MNEYKSYLKALDEFNRDLRTLIYFKNPTYIKIYDRNVHGYNAQVYYQAKLNLLLKIRVLMNKTRKLGEDIPIIEVSADNKQLEEEILALPSYAEAIRHMKSARFYAEQERIVDKLRT